MKKRRYLTEEGRLLFGRYKGELLSDVVDEEPSYAQWMKDELDLTSDEESQVDDVLEGLER